MKRTKSALKRDRKYTSAEKWEKAYTKKRKSSTKKYVGKKKK
jgi:hypothetical protein